MTETLPLTPTMRDLLATMPRDAARRIMRGCAIIFAILVPIMLIAEAVQRQLRFGVALEFIGLCALIVLVIGAYTFAERAWHRRAGLQDDTAIRYTGPLTPLWGGRSRPSLRLDGTTIHIEPLPLRERPTLHGVDRGTALFSRSGDLLFALWDEQGRCLHRYPGFDPDDLPGGATPALSSTPTTAHPA